MCSRRRRSGGDRYSTAGLETSRRNQNHRGVDAWLHLPWSLLYVCAGAIQIIAGIFYLMSLPVFRLGSNIYTGCWNVVVGISGGMLACVGPNGARRHEILMYLAISILTINVVNLLVLELGEWKHLLPESARKIIEHTDHQAAAHLARLSTSISSAITAIAAFIESQLAFCIINCCLPKGRNNRQKDGGSHDQGSDIEYIIPREQWTEAQQERLDLQRARVLEVNRHLAALAETWERGGLPMHMNLAVRQCRPMGPIPQQNTSHEMLSRLKQQNRLLTEEVSQKSERVTALEREKATLIRELLQTRGRPLTSGSTDEAVF